MKPYTVYFSHHHRHHNLLFLFLGFLLLSQTNNNVESVPLPTSTKGGGGGLSTTQSMTYSFYSTAEPVNVSARALSSTAAVVSWTLTKSISVIANNNNRTVISDIGDGGGGGADEVDQHQEQSSYSPVNNSIISPIRLEITYKPIQDRYKTGVPAHRRRRQKMVVAVPPQISSYILSDLRPGSVYTVSVTSIGKGHRAKSAPVQLVMMPRHLPSPPPPAHLNSGGTIMTATTRRPPPPPPPQTGNGRGGVIINYTDYYSNSLFPLSTAKGGGPGATGGGLAGGSNVGVYVRPEEIGIVILVLLVWVAAVALFFHRWGKIRMLLPYQPVFKEEEPVIVAACSPSPTLQRMMSTSSQAGMDQMMSERGGGGLGGGSQCQQSSPSSAVLVSANKFVSLDPAAIRRNQFKLHSRLARMQAYGERRPWPSTSRGGLLEHSGSGSMGSRSMMTSSAAAATTPPVVARRAQAFAANARRANTIAIEDPANPACCPACRCPQQSHQQQSPLLGHQGRNNHLQQQHHHHHHHHHPHSNTIQSRFQYQQQHNNPRRDYLHRLHHFHPAVQMQSSGSSDDQFPLDQQLPRKAMSAEVITLTVTECCETADSSPGSDKASNQQTAAALFAAASTVSTTSTTTITSTSSSSSSPTVISVEDATIIVAPPPLGNDDDVTKENNADGDDTAAIKPCEKIVVDIVARTPIESTL